MIEDKEYHKEQLLKRLAFLFKAEDATNEETEPFFISTMNELDKYLYDSDKADIINFVRKMIKEKKEKIKNELKELL